MSATSVATGERVLKAISDKLGVSDAGRAWITAAIDPYHDTALDVCGYPDTEESACIVQVVKSSYTIAAPSSAGSGNWDAHISSFPWLLPTTLVGISDPGANLGAILITAESLAGGLGGLMVDTVPTTTPPTPTFQMVTSGSPSWVNLDSATITPFIPFEGEWRQIAVGFEVINTTSDLNVQGLVTTYASPFPQRASKSVLSAERVVAGSLPIIVSGSIEVLIASLCPTTTATAMLLPGSRQWKAKEGAYVVPRLNTQDLAVGTDSTAVVLDSNSDPISPFSIAGTVGTANNIPNSAPVFTYQTIRNVPIAMSDFNWGGAYFTGLSNSSVLTVNITRYIERFPSIQNPLDAQLVVLAKPPAKYDPQAMELYSVVSSMMPTGVPQRMNGFGEWFREAVQEARNAIAPALAAIPHPLAQAAAGALRVGGSIADSYSKAAPMVPNVPAVGATYSPTGNTRTSPPRPIQSLVRQPRMVEVPSNTRIVMPNPVQSVVRRRRVRRTQAAPAA